MDNRAIGVFDSGLGGITAVRRMHEIMPDERIVYFGDTGRVPYGTRSEETIIKYTRQDVAFLRSFDLKAILVACGTVSSVALDTVAQETATPMFGVVQPACRAALAQTKNGRIGVIGTQGTIKSGAYERTLRALRADVHLAAQACPLFVPLVENGRVARGDTATETIVRDYLTDLRAQQIDTLILGCTHYPLLADVIGDFMGAGVQLINSGAAAADFLRTQIVPGAGPGETRYFVSDDPAPFETHAGLFLGGKPMAHAEQINIAAYDEQLRNG